MAAALIGLLSHKRVAFVRTRVLWALGVSDASASVTQDRATVRITPGRLHSRAARLARRFLLREGDRWTRTMHGTLRGDDIVLRVDRPATASEPLLDRYGRIDMADECAPLDWEGAIARSLDHPEAWRVTWGRATTPGARGRGGIASAWPSGGIDIKAPAGCAALLVNGYDKRLPAPVVDPPGIESVKSGLFPRVRHRIGTPLFTSNGILLRLDARLRMEKYPDEVLLAPEDLEPAGCGLIVLQGVPYEGALQHSRSEADLFRRFAVETAASGAHAVIVLPALPFELVTRVADRIAARVVRRRRPPARPAVARAVAEIKTEIVRYGDRSQQPDVAREIAVHVMHFVTEEEK
ncbi:MAG TPA: hypothetical protein VFR35_10830 [Actinoplanes sp.]|nr:hypothetical protein [Actinoplanes sp.]